MRRQPRPGVRAHGLPARVARPPEALQLSRSSASATRGSGKWERLTWDQACAEIGEKLRYLADEYGPETGHLLPRHRPHRRVVRRAVLQPVRQPQPGHGRLRDLLVPHLHQRERDVRPVRSRLHRSQDRLRGAVGPQPRPVRQLARALGLPGPVRERPRRQAPHRRRPALHRVFAPNADVWLRAAPRHRRRHGHGLDERHHQRGPLRPRVRRRAAYGFDELEGGRAGLSAREGRRDLLGVRPTRSSKAARIYATCLPAYLPRGAWPPTPSAATRRRPTAPRHASRRSSASTRPARPTWRRPTTRCPTPRSRCPRCCRTPQRDKQLGSDRFPFPLLAQLPDDLRRAEPRAHHHPYFLSQNATCAQNWCAVASEAIRTGKPYPVKGLIVAGVEPVLQPLQHPGRVRVRQAARPGGHPRVHHDAAAPCSPTTCCRPPAALERPQLWGVGGGGPCITGVALTGEAAVPPLYGRRDNYEFWRSLAEGAFDEETVREVLVLADHRGGLRRHARAAGHLGPRRHHGSRCSTPRPEEWHKMSDPKTGRALRLRHAHRRGRAVRSTIIEAPRSTRQQALPVLRGAPSSRPTVHPRRGRGLSRSSSRPARASCRTTIPSTAR